MFSLANILCYIALVAAVVVSAVFTVKRASGANYKNLILKVISSFLFILTGCAAFNANHRPEHALLIIIGLVFGLSGDAFLDMKYVYPKDEIANTFAGFASFIIGHVFYTLFLFFKYPAHTAHLITAVIVGVVAGAVIYLTPKLMKLDYGRFRVISSCYAAFLVFITVYSVLMAISFGLTSQWLMGIGLVLFLLSDLVLSQIYFGKDKNTKFNAGINHALYYAGQILIAFSIFFLV
ncbi:MAG: hypothetical protein IKH67_04115 [Lachnospiraceae bacterium]|nr:hypothetical protein [Lachnospiraceae bacterium]